MRSSIRPLLIVLFLAATFFSAGCETIYRARLYNCKPPHPVRSVELAYPKPMEPAEYSPSGKTVIMMQ